MRHRRPHGLILLLSPNSSAVSMGSLGPLRLAATLRAAIGRALTPGRMVPLAALASRIRAGRRQRPVVAITFDDGYADNLHNALPLLERYSAPATVFLATGWIDRGEPFWWDRLSAIVMSIKPVPTRISLRVGDDEFTWQRSAKGDRGTRATNELHLAVWSRLVVARDDERR